MSENNLFKAMEQGIITLLTETYSKEDGLSATEIGEGLSREYDISCGVHTLIGVLKNLSERDTIVMRDVKGTLHFRLNLGQKGMAPPNGPDDDASKYCAIA